VENVTGGASFLAGAAAALLINPEHALRAELRMDAPLTEAEDLPKSDLPAEAVLSARGRYASGLVWTLGGASGLTRGPGTASWRLFAGLSYARSGPEPVLRSDLEVQVVDPEGRPIPGARVSGNSGELLTATDGWTSWEDLLAGQAFEVVASHPDYNENRARVAIGGDDQKLRIALAPRMSALAVDVTNQDGQPVDARIEFLGGPVHRDAMQVGPDGKEHIVVPAGGWEIIAVAEGYAPRSARIDLKAGQTGVAALTLSPSRVVVKQDSIQILDKVYFDLDKATLKPESFPILEEVANTLKLHPEIRRVEVAGHTDSRGSDQYNLELSDARVNTVRLFLITQGVDASRLTSRGYGESRPIDPREDEDGWARNRRVEFVILERSP
jgi:outer membrane protein OmpA-like peptidoglycan-associated protein